MSVDSQRSDKVQTPLPVHKQDGDTPLHTALNTGKIEIVEALLAEIHAMIEGVKDENAKREYKYEILSAKGRVSAIFVALSFLVVLPFDWLLVFEPNSLVSESLVLFVDQGNRKLSKFRGQ